MKDINDIYKGLRAPIVQTIKGKKNIRETGLRYIKHGIEFGEGFSNYPHYFAKIYFNENTWENKLYICFSDNKGGYSEPLEFQLKTIEVALDTPYHVEKMKQEGVYNDFITYMDEKTAYDKQQRKLEQDRQLAYEQALKENPELTFEEFMSVQPMTLNLLTEPEPSEKLKQFMEKYL